MINITPTFLFELSNTAKGIPEGNNTNLQVPHLMMNVDNPKDIKFHYKDDAFLPNPVFPVELYEYRRDKSNCQLKPARSLDLLNII